MMRAIIVGLSVLLLSGAAWAEKSSTEKSSSAKSSAVTSSAEKVSIKVPGMVCQMCVQGMRKAFKDAVAVPDKDIQVDLDKKLVHLNLKSSLSDDEIKKRIRGTGYKAKSIERHKK